MKIDQKLLLHSFFHASLTIGYIALIAWIMTEGSRYFGQNFSILIPIAMLMLFVLSAAIVGSLVLGKPILMYLDGKKSEALKMFGYTLGWLALGTIIFFVINFSQANILMPL